MTNEGQNTPEVHIPQPLSSDEVNRLHRTSNLMPGDTAAFWHGQGESARQEAAARREASRAPEPATHVTDEFEFSSLTPEPSGVSDPEGQPDGESEEKANLLRRVRAFGGTVVNRVIDKQYLKEELGNIKTELAEELGLAFEPITKKMTNRWQGRSDELKERRADYRDRHGDDLWVVGSTVLDPDMSRKTREAQRESAKELLEISKDLGKAGMNKIQERWEARQINPIVQRVSGSVSSERGKLTLEGFKNVARKLGESATAGISFVTKRESAEQGKLSNLAETIKNKYLKLATGVSERINSLTPGQQAALQLIGEGAIDLSEEFNSGSGVSEPASKSRQSLKERYAKAGVKFQETLDKLSPRARRAILIGAYAVPALAIIGVNLFDGSEGVDATSLANDGGTQESGIFSDNLDDLRKSIEDQADGISENSNVEAIESAPDNAATISAFDIKEGDSLWKVAEDLGVETNDIPNAVDALSSDQAANIFKDAGIDTYKMGDGSLGLQNIGEVDSTHASQLNDLLKEKGIETNPPTEAASATESGAGQAAAEQPGEVTQQEISLAEEHGFTSEQLQEGVKIEVGAGDSIAQIAQEHDFNKDQIDQLTQFITQNHTEGVEYYNFVDQNGNTEVRLIEGAEIKLNPDQLLTLVKM